jgi:hypothetical protein
MSADRHMNDAPHVLVTGGAGYIGSHACKQLERSGYVTVSFDNLSTGWASAVKYGLLVEGDLLSKAALKAICDIYQPVAVMHFAALSQVGEATRNHDLYWRNNLVGSLNLVEAMIAVECKETGLSSTCATYGYQDGVMLDECRIKMGPSCDGAPTRGSGARRIQGSPWIAWQVTRRGDARAPRRIRRLRPSTALGDMRPARRHFLETNSDPVPGASRAWDSWRGRLCGRERLELRPQKCAKGNKCPIELPPAASGLAPRAPDLSQHTGDPILCDMRKTSALA